jgi:peptide chain release factor subunit 1
MKFRQDIKADGLDDLVPLTEIDLKALSGVHDERDTVLSVYFTPRKEGRSFVNSRLKLIDRAVPEDLKEAFEKTLDAIEPFLSAVPVKNERGRAVFASNDLDFFQFYRLGMEVEALVVLDTSPFLLPLGRLRNDYADYGLLLVDSREARLYLIRSNVLMEKGSASMDLMNKHKKGGWSQMRFNRLRRGAIKSFQREVVDDLKGLPDLAEMRGLVVAGPGEAKDQLVEMLPPSLKDKLLGSIDLSMDALPSELMKRVGDAAGQDDGKDAAIKLKAAILKGLPAAYGAEEVREALLQGRVKTLVLCDFKVPGMVCRSCRLIPEISQSSCPSCGGHLSHENIAEELYELAQRTGADVAVAKDDEFLESIGGIGAMLRY